MRKTFLASVSGLCLAASAAAGPASAATLAVLSGDRTITMINSDTWAATGSWDVSGIDGRLLGIDVRPADGMLYGVAADGSVVSIDTATGAATVAAELDLGMSDGAVTSVDFNPVADAIRIMGNDGTNLRAKFDGTVTADGNHAYAEADMHNGETPNIVAGAYTNSVQGAEATALYTIDATIGGLIQQDPPNDGTLTAIGKLGVDAGGTPAFDILADGQGGNAAWLLAGGTAYSVDVASGAATEVGPVEGAPADARDMAILPTM